MARKTKITPEIISETKQMIKLGMSYASTAGALGIAPDTFYNWMKWGKEGKEAAYSQFYAAVREAEAELMQDCLLKLRKVTETGNLESIKFILERRFPKEWGKQDNINIKSQSENVNVNVNPQLSQNETAKIRSEILAKLAKPTHPPRLNVSEGMED